MNVLLGMFLIFISFLFVAGVLALINMIGQIIYYKIMVKVFKKDITELLKNKK